MKDHPETEWGTLQLTGKFGRYYRDGWCPDGFSIPIPLRDLWKQIAEFVLSGGMEMLPCQASAEKLWEVPLSFYDPLFPSVDRVKYKIGLTEVEPRAWVAFSNRWIAIKISDQWFFYQIVDGNLSTFELPSHYRIAEDGTLSFPEEHLRFPFGEFPWIEALMAPTMDCYAIGKLNGLLKPYKDNPLTKLLRLKWPGVRAEAEALRYDLEYIRKSMTMDHGF